MAFDLNPKLVLGLKSPANWRGLLRHRLRNQINNFRHRVRSRSARQTSSQVRVKASTEIDQAITGEFERYSSNFNDHGWAFIPSFFSEEVHSLILSAWPSLQYFSVGADPTKSYDRGPRWSGSEFGEYSAGIHPDFYLGFEALVSENFLTRVSEFCGDGINRVNTSLASAWARTGSLLLPHIDDVWQFGRGSVINFVIFVDGSTPVESSGATSIYATNSYEKPIFIPTSLTNTALVYETGRFIYHGFPKVGRGKFSKRLIAQYSPEFQPKLSQLLNVDSRIANQRK